MRNGILFSDGTVEVFDSAVEMIRRAMGESEGVLAFYLAGATSAAQAAIATTAQQEMIVEFNKKMVTQTA